MGAIDAGCYLACRPIELSKPQLWSEIASIESELSGVGALLTNGSVRVFALSRLTGTTPPVDIFSTIGASTFQG